MATMTAADKRAQAKVEYDAFLAACPSRKLLDRISDKWVMLVMAALGSGPGCVGEPRAMRFSELSRLLAGVSQKMLTQTLRSLELDGLITRTATPTVPVTVSYELTGLGLSLYQMMRGLKIWAETHMDEVLASREAAKPAKMREAAEPESSRGAAELGGSREAAEPENSREAAELENKPGPAE